MQHLRALQVAAIVAFALTISAAFAYDDEPMPDTAPPVTSLAPEAPPPALPDVPVPGPTPAATETPEPTAAEIEATDKPKPEETPTAAETPPPQPVDAEAKPPPMDTANEREEASIAARRDRGVAPYKLTRPAFAFQFDFSSRALGGEFEASQSGNPANQYELLFEYQPPFLQAIGVLGIGLAAAIYPIMPVGNVEVAAYSVWSGGAQLRYQARFFREQPVVPEAGYQFSEVRYSLLDGNQGLCLVSGPFVGLMVLLNFIEPSAATEFYIDEGISRSYLVAEVKSVSGNDGNLNVQGQSYFLGLRLEF